MSTRYAMKEGFSGFTRAKVSTIISIFTVTISLLLLGVFAVITINASRLIELIRDRVELEVFLQEPLTRQDIADLETRIRSVEGVERTTFVSKEDAARIFKEEFGEDINSVLSFNPLPPSFKISLKEGYRTSAKAEAAVESITALKGVDNIVYKKALLELIDQRTATVNNLTLGLGVLVSLSAVFLVSNTIRLAIYAKRRIIRTMELVGATQAFIKLPFLLEGLFQGFLGGIVAACVLYVLLEYAASFVSLEFATFIHVQPVFYVLVVCTGTILGLVGGMISIARFMKPMRAH